MIATPLAPTGAVDLDYVALCLAEQIVRIKISATHYGGQVDAGALLMRPLYAVADTLGIEAQVAGLVEESLPEVA